MIQGKHGSEAVKELAKEFDDAYWYSVGKKYFPDYGKSGWKMGIFAGNNGANWRASGTRWRDTAFGQLDSIVTLTTLKLTLRTSIASNAGLPDR